jgi:hypothetical protein
MEENDDSLVAAALDASRFLTDLTVTEQAHMRELWAQKRMPVEMYGVVQLFRWSQSSRSRLLSDGLFKIALGAALAATNLIPCLPLPAKIRHRIGPNIFYMSLQYRDHPRLARKKI